MLEASQVDVIDGAIHVASSLNTHHVKSVGLDCLLDGYASVRILAAVYLILEETLCYMGFVRIPK